MNPGNCSLRVLVAEDNPINQKVALEFLRQSGHQPTLARTGWEVLALVAAERFDAILMDLHMPELDGLEATRMLRQREKSEGWPRTPVFALTASVPEGQREACREAGMDDLLVKPFRSRDLIRVLGEGPRPTSSASPGLLNRSAADRAPADRTRLARIFALFQEDSPRLIADLQTAVREQDPNRLARAAHALAGALAYLPAAKASELAQHLERLGRSGSLAGAEDLLATCQSELQRLQSTLLAEQYHPVPG
jgi:CheY-like chemotaxis protein